MNLMNLENPMKTMKHKMSKKNVNKYVLFQPKVGYSTCQPFQLAKILGYGDSNDRNPYDEWYEIETKDLVEVFSEEVLFVFNTHNKLLRLIID